jgi:hypothetical protein
MEMENLLIPLSFTNRKAPLVEKVKVDSERMYAHARYTIVLGEQGNVLESQLKDRTKKNGLDCIAVFAPMIYRGVRIEKALVLEIGVRRFVPYAETNFRTGKPTRRGNLGGKRIAGIEPKHSGRRIVISPRFPVAKLSEDALFDILPDLTAGIQKCVDAIVETWSESETVQTRWIVAGKLVRHVYTYSAQPSVTIRISREEALLCACASFADIAWRSSPTGQLAATARGIKHMLDPFSQSRKRAERDPDGSYEDEFVLEQIMLHYVADRLAKKVRLGYSECLFERLLDHVGPKESIERMLAEQIARLFKITPRQNSPELQLYLDAYGEMLDCLMERWTLRGFESMRAEDLKRKYAEKRKAKGKLYQPQARNCSNFSAFASKKVQEKMMAAYYARREQQFQADNVVPIEVAPKISYIPAEEDDDIPWEPLKGGQRTGTDDEIPF